MKRRLGSRRLEGQEMKFLLEEGRRRVRRAVNMACIIVRHAG
jgi:hypothetical protein